LFFGLTFKFLKRKTQVFFDMDWEFDKSQAQKRDVKHPFWLV
jgi:hypothetical protein